MLIEYYGFPADNITMLLDGYATKSNIEDELSEEDAEEDDVLSLAGVWLAGAFLGL